MSPPDDLAGLEVGADPGAEPEPEEAPAGVPTLTKQGFLSCEVWCKGYASYLKMSGNMTGLQTLLVSPDMPEFQEAAEATYYSICDLPALHFLVKPGGIWVQRVSAILAWGFPLAIGVKMELAERRAAFEAAERDAVNVPESEPMPEPEPMPGARPAAAMPGFD